ncbi:MAG: hydroxymethylglutaryl-CoA synthase [Chloroflexi bacterium]|nr:hydroxymethylglutaryl-CoA synthase [Chloroflexota bacterium]
MQSNGQRLMKPERQVGIVGYGAYIPRYRIRAEEIARVWKDGEESFHLETKSVPGPDEDTATIATEAARNALRYAGIDPQELRALWVGTESKPYAVKPTATIVAEALGATPHVSAADWEFACKAGTEAMQAAIGLVSSGLARYAMAMGVDTAQGRPGDQLEYTASAGGAAFIIGPHEESIAYFEGSYSYVSDTPDFFRRPGQPYPEHGHRFTGEPAYFSHTLHAARTVLEELHLKPEDYRYAVFHQPNAKFPLRAAQLLGFAREQVEPGLLVPRIGNPYAGSSLLGLAAVLDQARPGDRILLVSFGSGAGSDAFSLLVSQRVTQRRAGLPKVRDYIERAREIDYSLYARYRGKLGSS